MGKLSPRIPRLNKINTMGPLSGVHPSLSLEFQLGSITRKMCQNPIDPKPPNNILEAHSWAGHQRNNESGGENWLPSIGGVAWEFGVLGFYFHKRFYHVLPGAKKKHPLKLTASLPLKIGHPQKETIVFQPSIFRCCVSFWVEHVSNLFLFEKYILNMT